MVTLLTLKRTNQLKLKNLFKGLTGANLVLIKFLSPFRWLYQIYQTLLSDSILVILFCCLRALKQLIFSRSVMPWLCNRNNSAKASSLEFLQWWNVQSSGSAWWMNFSQACPQIQVPKLCRKLKRPSKDFLIAVF